MSKPITAPLAALKNASYSAGIAEVSLLPPRGMVTLRGDLATSALRKAATRASGAAFPEQRMITGDGLRGLAWMSPDELLVLCGHADAATTLDALNTALKGRSVLAVNVSDARAMFELKGPHARDVLAKLAPVDLSPAQFAPGMIRRTRLAQVAGAFWMTDDETFQIVCFRSVAQYVFDLLSVAAQPGSSVGFHAK
jgi:sarcosine oxidase subunit gamma